MNNWPEIIKFGIGFLLMPIWLPLCLIHQTFRETTRPKGAAIK